MAGLVKGVGAGILNLANTAGTVVQKTTELAEKTASVGLDLAGKTIGAAGLLGSATITAAEKLGTAAAETATDIGTSALDAATTVSTTALKTTGTTVEQTGRILQASVNASATLVSNALNGIRRVSELAAGRGDLAAKKIESRQAAEGKVLDDIGKRRILAEEAKAEFTKSTSDLRRGIRTIITVQKAALAGNITMYRGTQCGWWTRTFGKCKPEVATDVLRAKFLSDRLLKFFDTETAKTIGLLGTGNSDPATIVDGYMKSIEMAVGQFETDFKAIIDKYTGLIDAALTTPPPVGGRRRKAKPSSQRTRRAVRGRRASRRGTRKGIRGT